MIGDSMVLDGDGTRYPKGYKEFRHFAQIYGSRQPLIVHRGLPPRPN